MENESSKKTSQRDSMVWKLGKPTKDVKNDDDDDDDDDNVDDDDDD